MQPVISIDIPRQRSRFDAESWAVLGVAVLVMALGVALVWLRVTAPSDGARLKIEEWRWRPNGLIVAPIDEQPSGILMLQKR